MLTIACYKIGAVAHPIAMSYEEKELARSLKVTESRCYFAPTFFYKTDYEKRILSVREQVPLLKDIVPDRQRKAEREQGPAPAGNSSFL